MCSAGLFRCLLRVVTALGRLCWSLHGLVTGQDRKRRDDLELKLENPLGFFESKSLVQINDSLFEILGCEWIGLLFYLLLGPALPARFLQSQRNKLETYALGHAWVDKDPRLCITYSAYLHISPYPLVVFCVNHWPWLPRFMRVMALP